MIEASQNGAVDAIRDLLEHHDSPSELIRQHDEDHMTALHYASTSETAELILSYASEEPEDHKHFMCKLSISEETALHTAVTKKREGVLRGLVSSAQGSYRREFLFSKNGDGDTAFDLAKDCPDILRVLVDAAFTELLLCKTPDADFKDQVKIISTIITQSHKGLRFADVADAKSHLIALQDAMDIGCNALLPTCVKGDRSNEKWRYLSITLKTALHHISKESKSRLKDVLLITNKDKQNLYHYACQSPMHGELIDCLRTYLEGDLRTVLRCSDAFGKNPLGYLVDIAHSVIYVGHVLSVAPWKRQSRTQYARELFGGVARYIYEVLRIEDEESEIDLKRDLDDIISNYDGFNPSDEVSYLVALAQNCYAPLQLHVSEVLTPHQRVSRCYSTALTMNNTFY